MLKEAWNDWTENLNVTCEFVTKFKHDPNACLVNVLLDQSGAEASHTIGVGRSLLQPKDDKTYNLCFSEIRLTSLLTSRCPAPRTIAHF